MRPRPATSVLDLIGQTPLVELARLTRGLDGQIFAKVEFLNPGYSKKDRIALQLIEDAEASGALQTGSTVVELTSGNTGTGLAIVCAAKGYHFVAVMSRGNSPERARMMMALGAEVVLVDQCAGSMPGAVSGEDLALVEARAQKIVRERKAFRADQFQLPGNARAHYRHTAPEIWEQSGGIDVFCDFIGSGGSFAGCARYFKERSPLVRCYVVEPAGAAAFAGGAVSRPNHKIQGGGYAMPQLAQIDRALVDGCLQVSDVAAAEMTRRLARQAGLFAGYSSGANLAAALQLLEGAERGARIAILLSDSGLKYLSGDLFAS
ncbi:MAG: cysteine synthase family protein [Chloroflexi bacterium]|nr:cysteine synthase family protein [Chloroflexota bacterium]MCY4246246.1 cysteine synthase family protein [Chloroflexota bacterium]